jgi:signal transduction histidine kinase
MSTLGSLVADVAHEINNPVGFIAGNLTPAQLEETLQNWEFLQRQGSKFMMTISIH